MLWSLAQHQASKQTKKEKYSSYDYKMEKKVLFLLLRWNKILVWTIEHNTKFFFLYIHIMKLGGRQVPSKVKDIYNLIYNKNGCQVIDVGFYYLRHFAELVVHSYTVRNIMFLYLSRGRHSIIWFHIMRSAHCLEEGIKQENIGGPHTLW
jgi:hypothetical protein